MAPHDDDLLPENTSGYKLSQPKQSLAEYQKMGKFDARNYMLSVAFVSVGCVRLLRIRPEQVLRRPPDLLLLTCSRRLLSLSRTQNPHRVSSHGCWCSFESVFPFDLVISRQAHLSLLLIFLAPTTSIAPDLNANPAPCLLPFIEIAQSRIGRRTLDTFSQIPNRHLSPPTSALFTSPTVKLLELQLETNMSSGPRVTFLEPDIQELRGVDDSSTDSEAGGSENGALMHRPVKRQGSPYPGAQLIEGETEDYGENESEALDSVLREHWRAPLRRRLAWLLQFARFTDMKLTRLCLDAEDESLQRYKQSLGLGGGKDLSDPNDPRVCIIQSLTMESPGRDPVVIDLSSPGSLETLKKNPFKIKEGATFTMSAKFKVQHEILSGLHYVQVIKRKGIRIPNGKTDEMIVRNHVNSLRRRSCQQ